MRRVIMAAVAALASALCVPGIAFAQLEVRLDGTVGFSAGAVQEDIEDLSEFGFGTIITAPSVENFIVSTRTRETDGFSFMGGRRLAPLNAWVGLGYTSLEGDSMSSFSAASGGANDFGFTFLAPQPLPGGGDSTGLFVGNTFDVDAWVGQRFESDRFVIFFNPEGWTHGSEGGWQGAFGVNLTHEDAEEAGEGEGVFSSGGSEITNGLDYRISTQRVGVALTYTVERPISDRITLQFGASFGATSNSWDGRVTQSTVCGFCAPGVQNVERTVTGSNSRIDASGGLEYGFKLKLNSNNEDDSRLEAFGQGYVRIGGTWGQLDMPENPGEQPAVFKEESQSSSGFRLGLRYVR
jgi:hypothetical protein